MRGPVREAERTRPRGCLKAQAGAVGARGTQKAPQVPSPRGRQRPALTEVVEVLEHSVQERAGRRIGTRQLRGPGHQRGSPSLPGAAGLRWVALTSGSWRARARAPRVPARLPSGLRWRRPGSCRAAAEGAAASGEAGPPCAEEPPPAAAAPPPSAAPQAPPGTAAALWILPSHPTRVSPSAPPAPAPRCSFTR